MSSSTPVNINRLVTTFTTKAQPPTARPASAHGPHRFRRTSRLRRTTARQTGREPRRIRPISVPVFVEIFKQVKAIFVPNPAEVFTKYTGGREYSFVSAKGPRTGHQNVGQELHSQYLLSYSPNNKMEAGFHEISVQVLDTRARPRRDVKILTGPGYWMAAVPE